MSSRLAFLFCMSFFILNGCLYSCNYVPETKLGVKSTDPCNTSDESQFIRFISLEGKQSSINISFVAKFPCQGNGKTSTSYSITFYDANNFSQPSDLTKLKAKKWNFLNGASCAKPEKNEKTIQNNIENDPDFKAASLSAGITLGNGIKHPNRLYPYYIKVPYSNYPNIGTPHTDSTGGCVIGADMSPFIQNPTTLTPIMQKGKSITLEDGEIPATLALFEYKLVTMAGPLFTYAPVKAPIGSEQGIISTPNITSEGSYFDFSINLKKGEYYVVFAKVPDPLAAGMVGDFSLSEIKIFNIEQSNKTKDYLKDCNKDIRCGSTVRVT